MMEIEKLLAFPIALIVKSTKFEFIFCKNFLGYLYFFLRWSTVEFTFRFHLFHARPHARRHKHVTSRALHSGIKTQHNFKRHFAERLRAAEQSATRQSGVSANWISVNSCWKSRDLRLGSERVKVK